MDVLARIKRLVLHGHYRLTEKAKDELEVDGLEPQDVVESILNAQTIKKTLRSNVPRRPRQRERLYIIESPNFSGIVIYTKGKIDQEEGEPTYYVLISSKRTTTGD